MSSADGYGAAQSGAAVTDRSDRVCVEFTGAQTQATLNGLLTNDIMTLKPGTGLYAAALTPKGKIIADVRIFARNDSYLVDTSAAAGPGLLAMLKKYVNPRLAKFRDVSAEIATIGVFGPEAAAVVASVSDADTAALTALGTYGNLTASLEGELCSVARIPDLGVKGFDLFLPAGAHETTTVALHAAGAVTLDADTADLLRIEAGRPLWGTDMDENTLAQEAVLDALHLGAISFDKGCYTGQETVARVHFRGHVNRTLRGLRCTALVTSGSTIVFGDNANAGEVRSVALSPRLGALALAYVRREVPDGAEVTIRSDGGETTAIVSDLLVR